MQNRATLSPNSILLASALLVMLAACEATSFPADAKPMAVPARWALDWRITEACSGLSGDFNEIQWFSTPGSASSSRPNATGAFFRDPSRIVMNENAANIPEVVRHEMLHALQPDVRGHTANFVGECREIVACPEECLEEAGGLGSQPVATSRVLTPDSVEVSATLLPRMPGDDIYLALIVTVRNPRDEAVWVDLSALPRNELRCVIDGAPCGRIYNYSSDRAAFSPNEVRSAGFVTSSLSDTVTVQGLFNTKGAPPIIRVVP